MVLEAPARVGAPVDEIDTPALIVDLDRLEGNLARMADFTRPTGIRVRPHAKSHKCVALAKRQIQSGAVGLCAQKVSEAEPFIRAGIEDVLVSNEVVGDRKLAHLVALAAAHPKSRVGICVDDIAQVRALVAAAAEGRAKIDVYVELDVGQKRAGVEEPHEVVALAQAVTASPRLRMRGIQAYFGAAQHRRGVVERRDAIADASVKARRAKEALLAANLSCDVITGGGTGTFPYEIASGVYTEIQPGSYPLMDVDYVKNEVDVAAPRFEQALYLLATVMSRRGARATLDVGLKAQSIDCGMAQPTFPGWRPRSVHDEHAILDREGDDAGPNLALGDKVRLVPGHVDPTVNLHDWFVVVRAERVVEVWPIEARGAFF
jgi:D-serine deaminase-like pyridoxal phosphate-dependent protein